MFEIKKRPILTANGQKIEAFSLLESYIKIYTGGGYYLGRYSSPTFSEIRVDGKIRVKNGILISGYIPKDEIEKIPALSDERAEVMRHYYTSETPVK